MRVEGVDRRTNAFTCVLARVLVRSKRAASMVAQCERFALVHIDCDLGKPLKAALEFFYPRVSPGGLLVVHDYSSGWGKDVKPAVDKFMADKPETPILLPDKSGSVMIARSRMR